jgi:hypothetical protein
MLLLHGGSHPVQIGPAAAWYVLIYIIDFAPAERKINDEYS